MYGNIIRFEKNWRKTNEVLSLDELDVDGNFV